ncbi:unnamed protein product [Linum trigynum]|uniref:Uncharacterized protein n=1 Tax=Linum trigynum TaxID=586398 RepID=A0AAV2F482_9ROSI
MDFGRWAAEGGRSRPRRRRRGVGRRGGDGEELADLGDDGGELEGDIWDQIWTFSGRNRRSRWHLIWTCSGQNRRSVLR